MKLETVDDDGVRWVSFRPSEHPSLVVATLDLCAEIASSDIPLAQNYTPDKFELDNQEVISLGWLGTQCISMATLHRRPIYGERVLRTMNRYWRRDEDRVRRIAYPVKNKIHGLVIIPHHIQIALSLGYQSVFISRHEECRRYFRWLADLFNREIGWTWRSTDHRVQVCHHGASAPSCWQYLIYCTLDGRTIPAPVVA